MGDYKDKNKTTMVGDALRWLAKSGKTISPVILDLASNVNGLGGLTKLADVIRGDENLDPSDKEYLLAKLQADVDQENERTKRWRLDSKSQHWLPRLIRPLVVANFTILIDVVVIGSMWGKSLGEAYMPLLMTMGVTAVGGYFTLREYGKTKD